LIECSHALDKLIKMIKVGVREFKAKLSYYLTLLEEGDKIEVRGMVLCVTTGEVAEEKDVTTPVTTKMGVKELQSLVNGIGPDGSVEGGKPARQIIEEAEEFVLCDLCGGKANYEFWEEGEERKICDSCVRRKFGRGADRIIKGYKKI